MSHAVTCVTYSLLFEKFEESEFLEFAKKQEIIRNNDENLHNKLQNIEDELSPYLKNESPFEEPKVDYKNFNSWRDAWNFWKVESSVVSYFYG